MADIHEAKFKITAKNQARTAVNEAKQDFKNLGTSNSNVSNKLVNNASRVTGALLKVTGSIIAMNAAFELTKDAASANQSMLAFTTQVQAMGMDVDLVFADIKKKSAGLIDDKALLEASNRAISLGIDVDKLGSFLEIARVKARDMGTTTDKAFSDLVTALGRGSPLILDNLGIMVNLTEAYKTHAQVLGKTVSQLTELEKKQAFQNAAINAGAEALDRYNLEQLTTAERIQKSLATLRNYRILIGQGLIRAGFALKGVFELVAAGVLSVTALIGSFADVGIASLQMIGFLAGQLVLSLMELGRGWAWVTDQIGVTDGALERMDEDIINVTKSVDKLARDSLKNFSKALDFDASASFAAAEEMAAAADDSFKNAAASAKQLNAVLGKTPRGTKGPTGADTRIRDEQKVNALLQQLGQRRINTTLSQEELRVSRIDDFYNKQLTALKKVGATQEEISILEIQREQELANIRLEKRQKEEEERATNNAKLEQMSFDLDMRLLDASDKMAEVKRERLRKQQNDEIALLWSLGGKADEISHLLAVQEIEREKSITEQKRNMQKSRFDTAKTFGQNLLVLGGNFAKKAHELNKVFAIREVIIETYRSAQASYSAMAGIKVIGPALGVLAAAAAIASGIARVNAIKSESTRAISQPAIAAPSLPTSPQGAVGGVADPTQLNIRIITETAASPDFITNVKTELEEEFNDGRLVFNTAKE